MADDTFLYEASFNGSAESVCIGGGRVGAVVVCRDRIIGRGHNLTEMLNDVTAHAEMQAITAAANNLGRQISE